MLGTGEDQGPASGGLLQKSQQQLLFELFRHGIQGVRDGLGRGDGPDLDQHRVLQDLGRQSTDLIGHGGRVEKGLPLGRELSQDATDGRKKPHVAHGVGFIQDQDLNA